MQSQIIFPRVHIARNVWRFNREPPHLASMCIEERPQARVSIELKQFVTVREIDQDRMTTASLVLGLDQASTAFPGGDDCERPAASRIAATSFTRQR